MSDKRPHVPFAAKREGMKSITTVVTAALAALAVALLYRRIRSVERKETVDCEADQLPEKVVPTRDSDDSLLTTDDEDSADELLHECMAVIDRNPSPTPRHIRNLQERRTSSQAGTH